MKGKKCLLVIDVQNGMFNLPREMNKGDVILNNISDLIKKARYEEAAVIYMQHCGGENSPFEEGSEGWKIHPRVFPGEEDTVLKKYHSDAFLNTGLDDILRSMEIRELVICGFVTEGCVDTTIRRAYSLGYKLEVVRDCHSTTDSTVLKAEQIVNHHNEVFKIFSNVKKSFEIEFNG